MNDVAKFAIEKLEDLLVALSLNIEQVYPHFVSQVRLYAIVNLVVEVVFIILGAWLMVGAVRKENQGMTAAFLIGILILSFLVASEISNIAYPQPNAIQNIFNIVK